MHATIVSHNIRASWQQLNNHNCAPVLQQLAPKFRYVFLGHHALSGERYTKATLANPARVWRDRGWGRTN
jgi:predicted HD phosphohydrolase